MLLTSLLPPIDASPPWLSHRLPREEGRSHGFRRGAQPIPEGTVGPVSRRVGEGITFGVTQGIMRGWVNAVSCDVT